MSNADQRAQVIVAIADPNAPGSCLAPNIRHAAAVSKSDSTVLSPPALGLYIGTSGNLTVRMAGGEDSIAFTSVPVGFFPISVDKVYDTGTGASNIVALW